MRFLVVILFSFLGIFMGTSCSNINSMAANISEQDTAAKDSVKLALQKVDTLKYRQLMRKLANNDTLYWPAQHTPNPLNGAVLPYHRIVAYYGNLYSKKMGVLGEYPAPEMLSKLNAEVKKWNAADPEFPAIPALHYIAVVAQGEPGADGKHRFRMPEKHIDSIIKMAKSINALVFLDIQVAMSTVEKEVPILEKYLKMPQVHLGLDPEFSMKTGRKPGTVIGTMDAADINWATQYLKDLVIKNHLPPKVIVLHRFTKNMITNVPNIKLQPEVQFVMEMDGWGPPQLKIGTYRNFIYPYPKEFTGIKLFYKNDIKTAPKQMLTLPEVLKLKPKPIYIQYQ